MARNNLPLREVSIDDLFLSGEKCAFEIPIYQRNYAWEKDEIATLIQDVYDAYKKAPQKVYFIGTLVSYHRGDGIFEVIDGQQRLTTIRLILGAFHVVPQNQLTYRARKKSDDTLKSIPKFNVDEKDRGIENGFKYTEDSINEIVPGDDRNGFENYFRNHVHMIHYRVPKDIDLNHYFEVMNSRGEQLEKHEIVKANLMELLDSDEERILFNRIWECCSEMSIYVQQNISGLKAEDVFGKELSDFVPDSFDDLMIQQTRDTAEEQVKQETVSILDILEPKDKNSTWIQLAELDEKKDSFQPIIDFPNFLLIVLKRTLITRADFVPANFNLDDKELLNEFSSARMTPSDVKSFGYNLLWARFLLDNYIVHHSKEEDTLDSNPWKLQVWHKDEGTKKGQLKNLCDDKSVQDKMVHLLSMFEVSFTARQRKNYLFYCLMFLMKQKDTDSKDYAVFLENLADRYFTMVYLDGSKLNAINTPLPGSFDEEILTNNKLNESEMLSRNENDFNTVYGDGTDKSKGVPLFVFNYLDFKLWKYYDSEVRGEKLRKGSKERQRFFEKLGCSDFELRVFDQFYFSRTRRSLEHYYPQAAATGKDGNLDENQINCFGNYAMIGSEANSSGSNWSPKTKLDHYLDSSGKISQISVASLKFMIMMQMCREKQLWDNDSIQEHQKRMVGFLLGT